MDREVARQLIVLARDKGFLEQLSLYLDERILRLHKELETAEIVRIDKIQGQILELRRLKNIAEEVVNRAG